MWARNPVLADAGFATRLYIDVGARDYTSSVGQWFMDKYPAAPTFHVHAFEVEDRFDASYSDWRDRPQPPRSLTLHHFAAWVENATIPWASFNAKMGGISLNADSTGPRPAGSPPLRGGDGQPKPQSTKPAIDFGAWVRRVARRRDYVVLKLDVEGAEYALVPHLLRSGAAQLIDELFLEAHTSGNSCCNERSDRRWRDAMGLVRALRANGVYAHSWV